MTTPTTTKPATKTTSTRKTAVPAKPATTTRTTRTRATSKPAAENLKTTVAAATTGELASVTTIGGGKSATGDNGHGFRRAAVQRSTSTKPAAPRASKPRTDAAAKPVKTLAKAEQSGPTATQQKRIVADWMAKVIADGLAKWDEKKTGVSAEFAAQTAAGYLNYAPVQTWDSRLPDRSHAGGRGASKRAASA